jgi:propanediol dehydratase small subunit
MVHRSDCGLIRADNGEVDSAEFTRLLLAHDIRPEVRLMSALTLRMAARVAGLSGRHEKALEYSAAAEELEAVQEIPTRTVV